MYQVIEQLNTVPMVPPNRMPGTFKAWYTWADAWLNERYGTFADNLSTARGTYQLWYSWGILPADAAAMAFSNR